MKLRKGTVRGLKAFISQSYLRQTKIGEHLVALLPAIEEEFKILGVEILEVNTGRKKLRKKLGDFQILTKIGLLK